MKNTLISAENKLHELKVKTDDKIWQYVILREFINLFGENRYVLNFIASTYGASFYGILDDSCLLIPKELEAYEQGVEKTLKDRLCELLDIEDKTK